MATAQPPDTDTMTAPNPEERCVILRLALPGCSRAVVDDYALDVQEAVDASRPELGTAIRSIYEPMGLELLFTTEATRAADVQRDVVAVIEASEAVLPFSFETATTTGSPEHRELVPA
jgi:hypothetical protein